MSRIRALYGQTRHRILMLAPNAGERRPLGFASAVLASALPASARVARACVACALALGLASAVGAEGTKAQGCASELPADPKAGALMAALEKSFRVGPRVVRMDIRTTYQRRSAHDPRVTEPNQKTLWGVLVGDSQQTNLLYVFSGPGRLAGTTLLMHDRTSPREQDTMWLFLRAFDIFKVIEAETQQVMVPGTALSYEDSRGFVPLDKYRFAFLDPSDAAAAAAGLLPLPSGSRRVRILGCPRTETIGEQLGYRSILLEVDTDLQIVRSIVYTGQRGQRLKTYALLRESKVGDGFFPARVRLEHIADGFATRIDYEYWQPKTPPPHSLFEPKRGSKENAKADRFIDRLRDYLTQTGLGERIDAELALADERTKAFEDRLQRILDAERRGEKFRE